ncbi:synaptic vesicle glycoprotein 2B-like [Zootermopsis nevadensis]|uniref:Synaptic vesicle glycoprotein 2B n=1 Tax=Zootermopsis nevadensis TaxID=136037 RepID=A0A067RD65_ZOONE|nr:synaptic vesicle glycoprotein 2B-like [Zootermopsis nevadensis]KDR21687.1 Synaptic vesicle glycoprotein 2B [Zootermopsis nevadensis]
MATSAMEGSKTDPKPQNEQNGESHKPPTPFEQAIVLSGHGKFHLLLSIGCGFCLVAMVGEVFGTAFLIPAAQCEFEMDSSEKGLLNAISYIGMICSSHLWGYLADTRGRRKTLIVALVLDAVCGLASSLADTYWLFCLLRFFNGFFVCAPSAVVFAYLGEFHSAPTRSRAVMLVSVFLSVGGIFQQGLAWLIIPQDWAVQLPWPDLIFRSWRVFVVINALPSVATAVILFFLPESPKFLFSKGKEGQALDVLRRVFAVNTGRPAEEYPVARVVMDAREIAPTAVVQPTSAIEIFKSMWLQTKPLFQRPNLTLTTLACIIQFSLYASYNGFAVWLPDLYNRLSIYTERNPNHSLTICEVVTALANSTAVAGDFVRSTQIDNLTELIMVNSTEGHVANETWGLNNMSPCTSTVDPTVFRNSLAVGLVCITVYTCAGFLVKFIQKKLLMVVCLVASSVCIATINVANTELLLVVLSSIFIAMAGVSVNMLSSIVIDNIPTQLRAMAICLSLMSGRLGVTVCSLVLGILLDSACNASLFSLSGIVLVCCILTYMLPGPPKDTC